MKCNHYIKMKYESSSSRQRRKIEGLCPKWVMEAFLNKPWYINWEVEVYEDWGLDYKARTGTTV